MEKEIEDYKENNIILKHIQDKDRNTVFSVKVTSGQL